MTSNSGAFIAVRAWPRIERHAAACLRRAWRRIVRAVLTRSVNLLLHGLISRSPSDLRDDHGLEPLGGLHDWRGPVRS
jgi:hypothetical protein